MMAGDIEDCFSGGNVFGSLRRASMIDFLA